MKRDDWGGVDYDESRTKNNEDSYYDQDSDDADLDDAYWPDHESDDEEEDEEEYFDENDTDSGSEDGKSAGSDNNESELDKKQVEQNIKRFDGFLSPESPFNVQIPAELRNWAKQWDRFKGYMSVLNNPECTPREREQATNTIHIELLPLVKKTAARRFPTFINKDTYEDILMEGQLAIQANIQAYDPMKAPPLAYFEKHVLHGITVYVQTQLMGSTRVTEQNANRIRKAMQALKQQGVPENVITPAMLSRKTGLPVKTVEDIISIKSRQGTVPMPEDKTIASRDPTEDPAKAYDINTRSKDINDALSLLKPVERDIVERVVMGREAISEVAADYELNPIEAASILDRALRDLRTNKTLQQYDDVKKDKSLRPKKESPIPFLGVRKGENFLKYFNTDESSDVDEILGDSDESLI